jgi:hypothetical protein
MKSKVSDILKNLPREEKISLIKRIEIRDTMRIFATKYHRNTNGDPLRFDTYPHLVELYEEGAIHKDMVIMAGAQLGKTDWLVIYALASAYCGLNVFFILPKDDMRDSYVTEKVLKPIALSTFYQDIVRDGIAKSKDLINFGKGIIKFVGGKSEANFVSFSADIVICDETDQLAVPKNLELGMGRLNNSDYKFSRFISNPSTFSGFIYEKYQKSDKRVLHFPCKKCGKMQEIDFFENVVKLKRDSEGNIIGHTLRDKNWSEGDLHDLEAICIDPDCGGQIDRRSKESTWIPTQESELVGYKMPSFVSPRVSLSYVYRMYVSGLESTSKMNAFYITQLAEPFSNSGNKVSDDVLANASEPNYIFHIKEDQAYSEYSIKIPSVMGVDVASDHLDISISHQDKLGDPETHRLVFIGKMSPRDGIDFLYELIDRYNVICAVIDMVPETLLALEFQANAACNVWRCNFWSTEGRDSEFYDHLGQVNVNRREILDKSYAALKQGKLILPENYSDILEGMYVKEMTALSRISEQNSRGIWVPRWVASNANAADHQRFADAFRNLARESISGTILTSNNIFIG